LFEPPFRQPLHIARPEQQAPVPQALAREVLLIRDPSRAARRPFEQPRQVARGE
jgi:hypothetical protein